MHQDSIIQLLPLLLLLLQRLLLLVSWPLLRYALNTMKKKECIKHDQNQHIQSISGKVCVCAHLYNPHTHTVTRGYLSSHQQ